MHYVLQKSKNGRESLVCENILKYTFVFLENKILMD